MGNQTKWKLDPFDTEILAVKSYKYSGGRTESSGEFRSVAGKLGAGFYTVFIPVDQKKISILEKSRFSLINIRNTYVLEYTASARRETAKNNSISFSKLARKLTQEEMQVIAEPIWKVSRYHSDRMISDEKSLLLYRRWVENSLYNGYANDSFVAWIEERIAGLCTVRIIEDEGYIDLLGVLPEYQGHAIGSYLMEKATAYLRKQHLRKILVVTEGENIPANRFYQKNGFIIRNVELVYHCHEQ